MTRGSGYPINFLLPRQRRGSKRAKERAMIETKRRRKRGRGEREEREGKREREREEERMGRGEKKKERGGKRKRRERERQSPDCEFVGQLLRLDDEVNR